MVKRYDPTPYSCGQPYKSPNCCFDHWTSPGGKFKRKTVLLGRYNGNKHQRRQYASLHLNMTGNEYVLAETLLAKG